MNATYLALEVKRVVRGARFMIFTVAFPVVIYLIDADLFGSGGDTYPDGLAIAPSLMVRMAAFGAMSAALFTGARVALERSSGWQRQLRMTPMSGASYLLSKAAVSMLVALPTILLVSLAGVLVEHVQLSAGQWVQILLGVWLGIIPIVLLGLLIGLVTTMDSMQPVTSVVMLVLGMIGGLWIPSNIVPVGFQPVMRIFPTYWLGQIGGDGSGARWPDCSPCGWCRTTGPSHRAPHRGLRRLPGAVRTFTRSRIPAMFSSSSSLSRSAVP